MGDVTPLRFIVLEKILHRDYDEKVFMELCIHAKTTPLLIRAMLKEHNETYNSILSFRQEYTSRYSKLLDTHPQIKNLESVDVMDLNDLSCLYPEVKILDISFLENERELFDVNNIFSNIQSLEDVTFFGNGLTNEHFDKMLNMPCSHRIQHLMFDKCWNFSTEQFANSFAKPGTLDHLETIFFYGCKECVEDIEKLLVQPKKLHTIVVHLTQIKYREFIDVLDKYYLNGGTVEVFLTFRGTKQIREYILSKNNPRLEEILLHNEPRF